MNKIKNLGEAFIIFAIAFIAYGYFSFGNDWNTNSRLALVKAFVDEGRFEIDSYHETTGDKAFFNGHYYSDKAIGSSIFGVVAYYPIRWIHYMSTGNLLKINQFSNLVTIFGISLPTAFIAPFLYLLVKYITNEKGTSFLITLGSILGTPLFKYSTAFYGHSLAAVFYFWTVFIWFYARRQNFFSLRLAFVSSILFGFMVITEYPTVFLLFFLFLYILYSLHESKQLFNWKIYIVMLIGFLLPVCILFYYNNIVFGSILSTGYLFEANEEFRLAHQQSLMGFGLPNLYNFWYQTFQPAFGIFWQSPILFLALPGWYYMFKSKEYRIEAVFTFITVLSYILLFSGYYMWWGGVSFTPRHLIPILPLFAFPLAFLPKKFTLLHVICVLISVFQNLILAASCGLNGLNGLQKYIDIQLEPAWEKFSIFQPDGMLVYDVCLPQVINGELVVNRGMDFGLQGISSLVPFFVIELGLLWIFSMRKKI